MNRFLVPAAVAALLAGCARPTVPDPQSDQSYYSDTCPVARETTVIVREVTQEVPVYYADTVYYEESVPAETVYVEEEYETETYVYVSEPPPPHHGHPGWSPREHERQPSRPPRDGMKPREREPQYQPPDRDKPRPPEGKPVPEPQPPVKVVPSHPIEPTMVPVIEDRQKSPDRPTPPDRTTPSQIQAPVKDDSLPTAPVRSERPIPGPTAPVDKPERTDG